MSKMMMSKIDLDQLRVTLQELGYYESLGAESAPLVHRILTDLQQVTTQYAELAANYEDLYTDWARQQDMQKTFLTSNSSLDVTFAQSRNLDESFVLQAVEQAQVRYEKILFENERLVTENTHLQTELDRLKAATDALSQQLTGKRLQADALSVQVENLRQRKNLEEQTRWDAKLRSILRLAIALLPAGMRAAFEGRSSESGDELVRVVEEVILRCQREAEAQMRQIKTMDEEVARITSEKAQSDAHVVQHKATIAQLQSQMVELTARIGQKDFESSLQADLHAQLAAIQNVNSMIGQKVSALERLHLEYATQGQPEDVAHVTVQAMLESLAAELRTEIGFTTHLHQLVDKLNARRQEQDQETSTATKRLQEAEQRMAELENERADLRLRLERAVNDLTRQREASAAAQEATADLGQALESKQVKVEEYRRQALELKTALDNCNAAMNSMRRNEEKIRQHVVAQDQEIRELRRNLDQFQQEKARLTQQVNELQSELAGLKTTHSDSMQEFHRLSSDLRSALAAQEKKTLELRAARDQIAELEEQLAAKRREKDLVMATYCRAIKENERVQAEIQKLQDDLSAIRAGGGGNEAALKALQTRSHAQHNEIERLRQQLLSTEARLGETETKLAESVKGRERSEEDAAATAKEVSSLKSIISTLERSKKDLSSQLSRFGSQAAELRTHLRQLEEERNNLQLQLRSAGALNPTTRTLQAQMSNLGKDVEQLQDRLRHVERERDSLSHQMDLEKMRAEKFEQMMMQERNKRIENELAIQSLESSRVKLRDQLDMLNSEHEKSLKSVKRQMQDLRIENERLKRGDTAVPPTREQERSRRRELGEEQERERTNTNNGGRRPYQANYSAFVEPAPSPPRSIDDSPVMVKMDTTSRLKAENIAIRNELVRARQEIKAGLSDDVLAPFSGISTTSDDQGASPSSDDQQVLSASERVRRKLEQENKMLMQIVEQVKEDLKKAAISSPAPSSTL